MPYWPHSDPSPALHRRAKRVWLCHVRIKTEFGEQFCDTPLDDGVWVCRACTSDLLENLNQVDEMLADLVVTYSGLAVTSDRQGGSKSAETPLPFDDHASKAYTRFVADLNKWSSWITDAIGARNPWPICRDCQHQSCQWIRRPRPDRGHTTAQWLLDQVDWIRHQRSGASFATMIERHANKALNATDLPDGWSIEVGKCPELVNGQPCTGVITAVLAELEPSEMSCNVCGKTYASWQWIRAAKRIREREKATA